MSLQDFPEKSANLMTFKEKLSLEFQEFQDNWEACMHSKWNDAVPETFQLLVGSHVAPSSAHRSTCCSADLHEIFNTETSPPNFVQARRNT